MTYDLHGQWDFNNKWSDPSCPGGNCLRSGVKITETLNSLSMITKAGVPSSKVVVGVTSYGRSFQMTTPGCTSEMCTYTGTDSGAFKGICTDTGGYLANAEIAYLNATMPVDSTQSYMDDSFSNIFVYDSTQWVSYMDDTNKAERSTLYQDLSLGGTTDWAVDLQGSAQSLIDACGKPASSNGPFQLPVKFAPVAPAMQITSLSVSLVAFMDSAPCHVPACILERETTCPSWHQVRTGCVLLVKWTPVTASSVPFPAPMATVQASTVLPTRHHLLVTRRLSI
jgi:hypothetical protein